MNSKGQKPLRYPQDFYNIKCIQYETVDFVPQVFNYLPIIIRPTDYKIPNVPYKEQYESRDC